MTKELPRIPESLKNALKSGKVIPFVGSGISRAVQQKKSPVKASTPLFPSWSEYLKILADALDNRDKTVAANYVRNCLTDNPPDYLGAMQIAFDKLGEADWDELLERHFDFEEDKAENQSLELSRLIWQISNNLIITTNIDRVLQWTCPKPNEFKLLESQKKEFGKLNKENPPKCPTVVYFHGHIDNKANIIFTKEQYNNFYNYKNNEAKLETLKTLLAQATFLFLGFSMDDPYFLQQLRYLHRIYEGGGDSFFVLIHKNEKDNPNIPQFVRKIIFEDYGDSLLDLVKHLASLAQEGKSKYLETYTSKLLYSTSPINSVTLPSKNLNKKVKKQKNNSDKYEQNKSDSNTLKSPSEKQSLNIKNIFQKYWLIILVTVVLTTGSGWYYFAYSRFTDSTPIDSIAVLPFKNKNLDPETEYLSDGLPQSIIYKLSQLRDLKVSPQNSAFRYKGKEEEALKIGNELKVKAIMLGQIAQRGEDLFISVEIIDVRNNHLIWGEEYNRKISDLLKTQREIAEEITKKLELKLSGKDKEDFTKTYTNNNEAYQLFLKGRYHYAKRTKGDMEKGIQYLEQSVATDKSFALAYATLADAYLTMPGYPYLSPKQAFPKARDAAKQALNLDPYLAEAHTSWANYLVLYERNWTEAQNEFKRAIELNPNPFITHFRYGLLYHLPQGNSEDAISEIKQALEADPYSLVSGSNLVAAYIFAGQPKQALDQAKEINDLEPNFVSGRYYLCLAYIVNGMYQEAVNLSKESLQIYPTNQLILRAAGIAYAKNNQPDEAENIIKKLNDISKTEYVMSYLIASIYATLGDKDKAFAELEKSFEEHDWDLHRLKVDPFLESLRNDGRFNQMLKRLNFIK